MFQSCRDIFYHYVKNKNFQFQENIVLAEEVFLYFEHSSYKDLLSFEKDIAELSDMTVIFSESPGSIAELGSFSVLENVKDRLLVVMHQDDAYKESFIWHGPVLHLKELAKSNKQYDPIAIYNWHKLNKDNGILNENDFSDAQDLAETIENILSKSPKTEAFNRNQVGHIMLLMLDMLSVVQLATLDEMVNILKLLNIISKRRVVEQYLSLLVSLKFADRKPYGHNVYYLSISKSPWLSLSFVKEERNRDLDRWKSGFLEYYSQEEIRKYRALGSYMKSKGLIGE